MKLFLLSNSTNVGEKYLNFSKKEIKQFLPEKAKNLVFIPYAAVTFSYEEYESKVNNAWKEIGYQVQSIHHSPHPIEAIKSADAIITGGGNTWKLVKTLHDFNLMNSIKEKILNGTPYIGWSAGSNIACPTLKTTNDMPIVNPKSFETLNLIPFQINPHYLDHNPEGHGGETREQRILEFIAENKNVYVVGLREGTALKYENNKLHLIGNKTARIFVYGREPIELGLENDFNFLFQNP